MIPDPVQRWIIFVIACLLFMLSQFYRASLAVIAPDLIRDLALDTPGLSLISAVFFYAFALMQIPVGMYLDSIGPRIAMTVLSLVAVAGAILFATGHSTPSLVVARSLMGIGMACNLIGTLKLITLWFTPLRFATLSALVFSMGTLGSLIAATPLVVMVQAWGWRRAFMAIAAVNLLLALLFYLVARDHPRSAVSPRAALPALPPMNSVRANLGRLFAEKDYWIISLGTFCRYGIFAAVQALWAGPFLIYALGVSALSAGNLLLLMNIGLLVGSPACGWLSDTILQNRKRVIIAGLLAMSLVLVLLTRLPPAAGMPLLSTLFFAFGFFSGAGGIMYAHIKERMPPENAGSAMTGINFFTMIGVAVFLQGLGHLMQHLHPQASLSPAAFKTMFLFCALCLSITAVLYGFTVETAGRRQQPPDRN